jgi:hypothetical protein
MIAHPHAFSERKNLYQRDQRQIDDADEQTARLSVRGVGR